MIALNPLRYQRINFREAQRPLGELTMQFLEWLCECVTQERKHVLVVIRDNASWHTSAEVAGWVQAQNQRAKRGKGVRVVIGELPAASP